MLQTKKITLRVLALSLCCLMVVTSVICVPVSAAPWVVDVTDYITEKIYDGDDVTVVYDFDMDPLTQLTGLLDDGIWESIVSGTNVSFSQIVGTEDVEVQSDIMSSFITLEAVPEAVSTIRSFNSYEFLTSSSVLSGGVSNVNWNGVDYDVQLRRGVFAVKRINTQEDVLVELTYIGDPSIYDDRWRVSDVEGKYPFFIASLDPNGYSSDSNVYVYSTETAGTSVNLKLQETIILRNPTYTYKNYRGYLFFLGWGPGSSGIMVSDLKAGSNLSLTFSFTVDVTYEGYPSFPSTSFHLAWLDQNGITYKWTDFDIPLQEMYEYTGSPSFTYSCDVTVPEGAVYFNPYLYFQVGSTEVSYMKWDTDGLRMTHSLSAVEDNSKTQQQIVNKLDELDGKIDGIIDGLGSIEDVLEGTNDRLDGIDQGIQDTNDKLDDTNDKLDELPGQIGDEMQGVIDKEEQENTSAGQEFVDQILDILPDNSTEIMGALKGLTDAMSYTGTEAVITIPGITMPAVGKLIPRTVLWDGANMDFGEYVEMLPSLVLTLVRYLFTIAIVLYCAYELKGIVSYCLTLKESKGG